MAGGRIRIALAGDEHAEAIAAFYREVWSKDATAESVRAFRRRAAATNFVAPGEVPPTALAFDAGRVIGYCGSIPQRLWDGVAERPAYWAKGLMVLPEYRNGLTALLLVKEIAAQLPRSMTLTVAEAPRGLLSAVGYRDLGAVPNFVRPLRGAALARRLDLAALGLARSPAWVLAGARLAQRTGLAGLAGGVLGGAAALAAAATRRAATRLQAELATDAPPEAELDDLWRRARPGIAGSPVRDGLYLRSRFADGDSDADGEGDGPRYVFITTRALGALAGVAVLRRPRATSDPRLHGLRVATISDIVFPPERGDVAFALLGGVERAARSAGADAILCTTSHHALARRLRWQAYVRVPGNMHFFLRDVEDVTTWPPDLASWWLARGDGEADGVF